MTIVQSFTTISNSVGYDKLYILFSCYFIKKINSITKFLFLDLKHNLLQPGNRD